MPCHSKRKHKHEEPDMLGPMNKTLELTTNAAVGFTGMAVITNMSGQIIKKL